MRSLSRWLLVVVLSLSIGLQWLVVQSAAWVGMVVSFSKETTLRQAVVMTFDGRHPCDWCKAAQRGESTQKKENAGNPTVKMVLAAPEAEPFVFVPNDSDAEPAPGFVFVRRSHPPPSPPPRAA